MIKHILLTTNLPDWAEWIAIDENGAIYIFSKEPKASGLMWVVGAEWADVGKYERIGFIDRQFLPPGWDWRNTKRRISDYS